MFSHRASSNLLARLQSILLGLFLGIGLIAPVLAAVDIEQKPLFTTPAVVPALIMAVDDSGSMDSEVLMKTNDGALWWNTSGQSFVESSVLYFNSEGTATATWKKFVYLFPNGTGQSSGRRQYSDSTHDHYAIPPIGAFAFARSPEYNMMYFNPDTTYEPWPDLGGYTFSDATPTAAKTDPTKGSETFNLTELRELSSNNHVFKMYQGMTIPAGTRYRNWSNSNWETATEDRALDQERNVPIAYFPATFYLKETTSLPAEFGFIANNVIADGQTPDGSLMLRYEIKSENFQTMEAYNAAIQNFANWFTYYHKRHIVTRGAIGEAFEDIYGFRIGSYLINSRPSPATNLTFRDLSDTNDREDFFEMVYEDYLGGGGTPNRLAVDAMWSQLQRTDAGAPIQEKCQMNFGVLFTDGYSNPDNTSVGNRDDELGSPFADDYSNTMGDIAARLYLDNPRQDLPTGAVPVPLGCSLPTPPLNLDCNTDLHASLFALTMGAPGSIFNVNMAQTEDPYSNPPTWPDVSPQRSPVQIDDLWHATLNSRGILLSVDVPSELGAQFGQILAAIGARLESSSSSAATSSAVLNTDTLIYTAGFRSDDWSGSFNAHDITADEKQGDLHWDAEAELLTIGANNRQIFTRAADTAGTGSGAMFSAGNLTTAQLTALDHNENDTNDGLGNDRIAWLRGDESANGAFRDRQGRLLGDIVNSDPFYADGVLYVGANDGMLHAFDGTTGEELFAFIPSELLLPEPGHSFAPVSRLTNPAYVHRYLMDGSVMIATAELNGVDKKILVSSLGLGGRSVFALDVTDATSFSAADVLWEYRDEDLGYGVGQPLIGQLENDTWVTVFGNGYNSDHHRAFLYVVNLDDGSLIAKLDTGAGDDATPNGLASPIGTHWPEMNGKAQRIYAGDLLGNLWRFDVSDHSSGNWTVNKLFSALDGLSNPQPITSRPAVGKATDMSDAVVTFGTGSYFRTADKTDNQIQSLYGIFDKEDGTISGPLPTRADLLEQTIVYQGVDAFDSYAHRVRVVSENTLDTVMPERGWYLDFDHADTSLLGERVISPAMIAYAGSGSVRARFSTLIPDDDLCGFGRDGYFMDIDLITGGRTGEEVLDLNFDGVFDASDQVLLADGSSATVSGLDYGQGEQIITVRPMGRSYELLIPGGGQGVGQTGRYARSLAGSPPSGRLGWRQIRPEINEPEPDPEPDT